MEGASPRRDAQTTLPTTRRTTPPECMGPPAANGHWDRTAYRLESVEMLVLHADLQPTIRTTATQPATRQRQSTVSRLTGVATKCEKRIENHLHAPLRATGIRITVVVASMSLQSSTFQSSPPSLRLQDIRRETHRSRAMDNGRRHGLHRHGGFEPNTLFGRRPTRLISTHGPSWGQDSVTCRMTMTMAITTRLLHYARWTSVYIHSGGLRDDRLLRLHSKSGELSSASPCLYLLMLHSRDNVEEASESVKSCYR
ncbi:hypothetical protein C8F01DRAFT_445632 [Mycena amicta]|nr:hypothetical protein C8F01DRAFT_445632 [Mycena amicta]